jgi:hypothetical protein
MTTRTQRTRRRHPARFPSALALGAILSTTVPLRGAAQGMPQSLAHFLQQTILLSQDELRGASSGNPVVKALETSDRLEIAVFGIVSIDVPRSFQVQRAVDFPSSLRDPSRLRFAVFSDPVAASDVINFSLPHADVQDLARCRPGACRLKLSSEAVAELRAAIDPASPSADSVASAYFGRRMMDYVTAYRARGNGALIVYNDYPARVAAANVFDAMLSHSPYMYQYAPSLERYLENYPKDRPMDVSEALFWSEDDLPGLRPTLTLTHEVVYAPSELPGSTLIALKLLYADHFLDGALDLTAVVDQAGSGVADPRGIYLVVLRRLHFDDLSGPFNVRGRVIGELRNRTKELLRDAKTSSERAYAGAPHAPR